MTFMAAYESALNRATETKVTIMKLSRWKVCGTRCRFVEPNLKYVTARYVAPRAEWCHEFLISRNKQLLINKIIPQNIFIFPMLRVSLSTPDESIVYNVSKMRCFDNDVFAFFLPPRSFVALPTSSSNSADATRKTKYYVDYHINFSRHPGVIILILSVVSCNLNFTLLSKLLSCCGSSWNG